MARIIQILVNAAALWVAVLITEMDFTGAEAWQFLLVAVIFSLVNTFIRPILRIITLPITAVTLGLFLIVINALMLLLTGWISDQLDLGFMVNGFVPALLGAIVISIVSWVLSLIMGAITPSAD
ncbi:MAG TPA: phage holin family protein [Candidatus Limnocylindria bacterium]|nr:phage holin family protein [Candidatus Limnocylindria bacterium]